MYAALRLYLAEINLGSSGVMEGMGAGIKSRRRTGRNAGVHVKCIFNMPAGARARTRLLR